MELTTGQIEGQEIIDIASLKKELPSATTYKVFIDTIDENNEVFVDGEVLVVHVARSEYNGSLNRHRLVRER